MDSTQIVNVIGRGMPTFIAFLFALCFHEYAHGWMAKRKGDRTAEMMGRLTLNPFAHADLVGTFILPAFAIFGGGILFGWAKPVPVNPRNLRYPKEDMFWIALAGPLSNLLLALLGGLGFVIVAVEYAGHPTGMAVRAMLDVFILINIFLALFNMIPLHPLDGGKVLARFLPESANNWLETNQMYLNVCLIVLFISGGFRILAVPVYWLHSHIKVLAITLLQGIF
jgi:Zn-dependent protease